MKKVNTRKQLNKVFGVILIVTISLFVLITLLNYRALTSCDLTDKDAEIVTLEFSKAINIQLENELEFMEPSALHYASIRNYGWSMRNAVNDLVEFFENTYSLRQKEPYKKVISNDYELRIGCKSKAIRAFSTRGEKYPLVDFKKIAEILSTTINSQKEIIFKGIEKSKGHPKAKWNIALKGYEYYRDGLTITLRDSKRISYIRLYENGTICPTNIEIDKDKALELAWNRFIRSIDKKMWKITGKGYFDIESADLFIVQPEKLRLPFRKNPSRLAWVIKFVELGDPQLKELRDIFNDPKVDPRDRANARKAWEKEAVKLRGLQYPSIIRIDAETGKAI